MASSNRFVAVAEEEMERLLSDKDSKNTKRKISRIYLYEYIILNIIAILRYFPLFLLSENFPSHASRDGKLSLIAKGC
jgi:hypothetical protein